MNVQDFSKPNSNNAINNFVSSWTDSNWLNSQQAQEFSKFGYALGVNGVYNLKTNFTISSGLLFSNKGDQTKKELTPSLINPTE